MDVNTIHIIRSKKSSMTLKNNKSHGMDQISVELIKYSPEIVYKKNLCIYNNFAVTGKYPNEITHGILGVLQKPGKPKGATSIFNNSLIRF